MRRDDWRAGGPQISLWEGQASTIFRSWLSPRSGKQKISV